jgi:hypothetical protein
MPVYRVFAATVNDRGGINFHDQEALHKHLASFKEGDNLKVIIKPFKTGDSIRSVRANAYYWGVVIDILRLEFGYEKEEMHDALGLMFRRSVDEFLPTIQKTSDMNSREFWEYIERVRRWAAMEYNITIPDPNKAEGAK